MITAEKAYLILSLIVAIGSMTVGTKFFLSRMWVKISPATMTFSAIFILLCLASAYNSKKNYDDQVVRINTWISRSASVVKQERLAGRGDPCSITYKFSPLDAAKLHPDSYSAVEDLETRDVCDLYQPGSEIKIHYPPGDPSRSRIFIHGDDSKASRILNHAIQSLILDLFIGILCVLGLAAVSGVRSMFFTSGTSASKT